jgi:hypothetical protein
VIDYFTNVGDIINSWAFNQGNMIYCVKTVRRTTVRNYSGYIPSLINAAGSHITDFTASGGDATLTQRTVSRSVLGTFSLVPNFEFSLPIRSKPWVNIAALILGRSGR